MVDGSATRAACTGHNVWTAATAVEIRRLGELAGVAIAIRYNTSQLHFLVPKQ